MKRIYMAMVVLGAVSGVHAGTLAADDFSTGTIGTEINGVAVQSGAGTWTDAGILSPLEFGAGDRAVVPLGVDGGHAAVASVYPNQSKILTVTTVFSVGSSKANNPAVSLGLYESINKSFLQNIDADDFVSVRFVCSGASEGRMIWRIYDEGVSKDTSYEGSAVAFASNDVIRLTLSYDLQSGVALAEAYNITQGSLINTGIASVPGVNGFQYAALGVAGLVIDAADPFYFDSFQTDADPSALGSAIASDDFSDGTIGDQVDGVAVQTGVGMWTKAILPPLEFGAGGQAVIPVGADAGYALISRDYSSYTNSLKMTSVFSVGASKLSGAPSVTVGFYETLIKGHLQNENADDFFAIRLLTAGPNEGRMVWRIYDEGVAMDTTYEGSTVTFGATDVLRLTISYDSQTGAADAELYNITQDSLINTGTATVPGLSGFNYAGMGVVGLVSAEADSFFFERIQVESVSAGYAGWASGWGVGAETNDYDQDGLLNIYEYGLGGDPTDPADQGIPPEYSMNAGTFTYVYPQLSDPNSGITYHLELNTDLVAGTWVNTGYTVTGTNIVAGDFNFVTNTTGSAESKKFIKLIIE